MSIGTKSSIGEGLLPRASPNSEGHKLKGSPKIRGGLWEQAFPGLEVLKVCMMQSAEGPFNWCRNLPCREVCSNTKGKNLRVVYQGGMSSPQAQNWQCTRISSKSRYYIYTLCRMEKAWLHQGTWQDLEGKLFWITGKGLPGHA
jgi:hypothetical protein